MRDEEDLLRQCIDENASPLVKDRGFLKSLMTLLYNVLPGVFFS